MSEKSIKCVHLVHFSPSGSTEKIIRKIASGIQGVEVKNTIFCRLRHVRNSMFSAKRIW